MKISVPTYHEVTLKDPQLVEITRSYLNRLLKGGEYLRERKGIKWVCQDDPDWRHGSVSEEYMREATEIDLAIFKILEALNGYKL